ncbi:MAG: hypothetical protein KDA24_18210 [Deltaproteobacteria bacterium]|nr:hypothetical protein [Deltaproteobacteria bacterium]
MRALLAVFVLGGALCASSGAEAHQADQFATSPKTLGMAGAGGALTDGAGSLFSLPSAVALEAQDIFRVSWMGGRIHLAEVQGVDRIDDEGNIIPGDSLPPSRRLPEQGLTPHAVTVDLLKTLGPFVTAGAYVTFPIPNLYFHDSQDPWSPNVVRWRNRIAQSTGVIGGAVRLPVRGMPGVGGVSKESALQGGVWLGFSLGILPNANIDIDLDLIGVDDPNGEPFIDVALRDVDLVVKARFRPTFSVLIEGGTFHEKLAGTRLGFTARPPTQANIDPIHLDVEVLDLGNLLPIFNAVQRIQAEVWLGLVDFYEPWQLKLSLAHQADRWAVSADVQWNNWSSLVASYGRVVVGDEGDGGSLYLDFLQGSEYAVVGRRVIGSEGFRDSVDLAFGGEVVPVDLPVWPGKPNLRLTVRAGYRYQSSMLKPVDGPSALLDGDVHTGGVGLGLSLPSLPIFDGPFVLDWGLQVQRIGGMDLPKTAAALEGIDGLPVVYSDNSRWPGGWAVVTGLQIGTGF